MHFMEAQLNVVHGSGDPLSGLNCREMTTTNGRMVAYRCCIRSPTILGRSSLESLRQVLSILSQFGILCLSRP